MGVRGALVLTAALVAAATIGAPGAAATELCSAAQTPCTATMYGSGTTLKGEGWKGGVVLIETSLGKIQCTSTGFSAATSSTGGSGIAISGEMGSIAFNLCKMSATTCTSGTVNLPYNLSIKGGGTSAFSPYELELTDSSGVGAYLHCGSLIDCTFTTKSAVLDGLNEAGKPSFLAMEPMTMSGGLCPFKATWTATYEISQPSPLWVV